ncbi:hypothetical protein [Paenibacillus sp. GCM10012303]|uniref:hypothetical protein n=1 Tax=Paenibacillus sp. GCM10012303 TaxID=3317340 RepID=UPI00361DDC54
MNMIRAVKRIALGVLLPAMILTSCGGADESGDSYTGYLVPKVESFEEFQSSVEVIPYDELKRNPSLHRLKKVELTGKIIYLKEDGHFINLKVHVPSEDRNILQVNLIDVHFVRAYGAERIVLNDTITLWGVAKGLQEYGIESIPVVDAKFIAVHK